MKFIHERVLRYLNAGCWLGKRDDGRYQLCQTGWGRQLTQTVSKQTLDDMVAAGLLNRNYQPIAKMP